MALLAAFTVLAQAFSPNPDLTVAGAIATLKTDTNSSPLYSETYNLGATGLRGWIYIGGGNGQDGTITVSSRQILVTVASAPGNAVLAVDDVILGAMAGSSGIVPLFASDARKAFGAAIGDARADGTGGWSFAHRLALSPGQHRLRIDMLDAGGKVLARAEVPFEAAGGGSGGPVTVRPGQSLWRIAETAYGDGVRYVEIFAANRGQISDPNLIYPGQVFALPPAALPQGSIPASSSQSR